MRSGRARPCPRFRILPLRRAAPGFIALVVTRRLETPALRQQTVSDCPGALSVFNFIWLYMSAAYVAPGLISVIFRAPRVIRWSSRASFLRRACHGTGGRRCADGGRRPCSAVGRDVWVDLDPKALRGSGSHALGTLFFSLGNMISRRNSAAGVSPVTTNAWGMASGAVIIVALIAATRTPVVAPPDGRYLAALLYLPCLGR